MQFIQINDSIYNCQQIIQIFKCKRLSKTTTNNTWVPSIGIEVNSSNENNICYYIFKSAVDRDRSFDQLSNALKASRFSW